MGDIAKHFDRSEFTCKCGCGFDTVDLSVLTILVAVRIHFNAPVTITSGCRCFAYNRLPVEEGGAGSNDESQHPRARAADIQVKGVSPKEVYDYLCQFKDKISLGLYETFVHVDTRTDGGKRW